MPSNVKCGKAGRNPADKKSTTKCPSVSTDLCIHPLANFTCLMDDFPVSSQELIDICLKTFCSVKRLTNLSDLSGSDEPLRACSKPILRLLLQQCKNVKYYAANRDVSVNKSDHEDITASFITQRLDDLIAIATEKFYAFPFKDVPVCWRHLFWESSLLKLTVLVINLKNICPATPNASCIDQIVRTIDMALIMAGPPPSDEVLESISEIIESFQKTHLTVISASSQRLTKRRCLEETKTFDDTFSDELQFLPQITNPVPRKKNLSFDAFQIHLSYPSNPALGPEPLIVSESLNHWPALSDHPWNSPSYLLSQTVNGKRLVPIELGRSYVDEDWGQKIITFKEFLENHIQPPRFGTTKTGYLAQHNLFSQIPKLRNDVAIPDYCFASAPPPHSSSQLAIGNLKGPRLEQPLLNAWFGPAGTITPLHTDPYHNIIAQVVGKKYFRLYSPQESEKLYPRGVEYGGIDMQNTSAMDISLLARLEGSKEEQDEAHKMFPLFKEARYVDCVLESGECLYIPIGWWHYVRSLSISFSVSFWFN
ncbi:hypothetical protein K3495_g9880 [Podosphaera aphanis]|nr:hypothetical protein K3495_g9880 [Podosphaera aphanis]